MHLRCMSACRHITRIVLTYSITTYNVSQGTFALQIVLFVEWTDLLYVSQNTCSYSSKIKLCDHRKQFLPNNRPPPPPRCTRRDAHVVPMSIRIDSKHCACYFQYHDAYAAGNVIFSDRVWVVGIPCYTITILLEGLRGKLFTFQTRSDTKSPTVWRRACSK